MANATDGETDAPALETGGATPRPETGGIDMTPRDAKAVTSLWPLMFETFVCTMAVLSFVALAGPIARLLELAAWQIGIAMTTAGIAWIVMSRQWGIWSDRHGRRPVMLMGLAGFAISYALLCLFMDLALRFAWVGLASFIGIVVGRTLAGGFYAAVPSVVAAFVADNYPPERRAGAMATIGAAGAAGMVFGPALAGMLATIHLSVPLYGIAALPLAALIVLWFGLPRSAHHEPVKAAPVRITDVRLRRALAMSFVAAFCVANAQIVVGFYAIDRLALDPEEAASAAGIALGIVGVSLVVSQSLLRWLGWRPLTHLRLGSAVAALGFGSVVFAESAAALWIGYGGAALGMGWIYPSVPALAANSVEMHEQGAAAGTVSAAQGLGTVLGPLAGTAVYAADLRAPYALVSGLLILAALWPSGKTS